MSPHLNAFMAAEHQRDLERASGCCTPLAEYRRDDKRAGGCCTRGAENRHAYWHNLSNRLVGHRRHRPR